MTWPAVRLGDVCDMQSGGTPRRGVDSFYGGPIPWAKISDLETMDGVVITTEESLSKAGLSAIGNRLFSKGTILLAMYGSIGKTGVAGCTLATNQAILGLVPRDAQRLDPRFLRRWLDARRSDFVAAARGVTQANISKAIVQKARIPLPPIDEQRRIADILDKADSISRKRKETIALTEELLRSAFLDMVGPGASEYDRWPVRTIESLAANMPNSLRTGPFGSDLLHSEFVDEGIAVLGIDNAVRNRFAWGERRFITPEKYDKLRRYSVMPGDILVTIMGTTGRSAVVPGDIPTAITTKHLATITLDRNEAEPEFVSQALFRHPDVLQQIAAANRGAIMSGLNLGLIKALHMPIPPLARQRKFAQVTARIRALVKRMEDHGHAEELFNSLIARAFSGDLSAARRHADFARSEGSQRRQTERRPCAEHR